jgi:hypothetical protein
MRRKYRAFISYSQRDKLWARRIQVALETYRVPLGIPIDQEDRRLGRIFRDEDEMGASTDLGATLRGAISEAESLIVIASPAAARSKWVNEEVLHFKRTGRADRIFAVVVDGVPGGPLSNDASDRNAECYPPALKYALDTDGNLSSKPTEPLGIDVRKESSARLRAKLASGLLGVPFDDLWKRDTRRRYIRIVQSSSAAIAIAVGLFFGVTWFNRQEDIRRIESPAVAAQEAAVLADGRAKDAYDVAIAASGKVPQEDPARDIEYVEEGFAGGVRYSGSRSLTDRRWFHVVIRYTLAGHRFAGEVPYTDRGEFVGQGGEIQTKYGVYDYGPNCLHEGTCELSEKSESDSDQDRYSGSIVEFEPQGAGIYTFANGDIYRGQFNDDAIDGYGVLTKSSGDQWIGVWSRNRSTAPGLVRRVDGSVDFAGYAGLTLPKRSPLITGE